MKIPNHIGIIPDGNRRWAVNHGKEKFEGYSYGINPGLKTVKLAKELGVKEITFYGFTNDNCKREKKQRLSFSQACIDAVNLVANESCDILVVGNDSSKMFPKELLKYRKRTSVNGGGIKVNFLVNYGWDWDIMNIKNFKNSRCEIIDSINSHDISRIDLIIRWGSMCRLSGFLPVQSVYSDIFVCDNLWPDFKESDFFDAINWYQTKDVTLGG